MSSEKVAVGITEAGEMLSVRRDTIYRLLKSGDLPSFRVRGRRLIAVQAIREFVEKQPTDNSL